MTTAVEMPKTITRGLFLGFELIFSESSPVQVPITNFSYHAALDEADRPIADWVGVYHGMVQLRDAAGNYFWKGLMFEVTRTEPGPIADSKLTAEKYEASKFAIRFAELTDTTGPADHVVAIEPVIMLQERTISDHSALRKDGQLLPSWRLVDYKESLDGERRASLMQGDRRATLVLDRSNVIQEIVVDGKCVKSLKKPESVASTRNIDDYNLVVDIEYSFLAQRFAKAIVGQSNPIIEAGRLDLSEIAAPTYVNHAAQNGTEVDVPAAAYLDADSPTECASTDTTE